MIVFSTLDKICYITSLISLVIGVLLGITTIWVKDFSDISFKIIGTVGLLFLLSVGIIFLNKLIKTVGRVSEQPKD